MHSIILNRSDSPDGKGLVGESVCKPDSVPQPRLHGIGGDHPSATIVTDSLMRPTCEMDGQPFARASVETPTLLGLAPGGVYPADHVAVITGGLLHHRFTLTLENEGGLLSVALARGSPRVGVTHHLVLWSPDFPQHHRWWCRDRPTDSPGPE